MIEIGIANDRNGTKIEDNTPRLRMIGNVHPMQDIPEARAVARGRLNLEGFVFEMHVSRIIYRAMRIGVMNCISALVIS